MRQAIVASCIVSAICLSGCGLVREARWSQARQQTDAVSQECKNKRLRGELKTYRQSVECSNPRIAAIWQEAGDTYMDLVHLRLAARMVCADNIDSKQVTEAECDLQLAELETRITSEAQRRNATNANIQAAQMQSTAAMMQGLAALQQANRPAANNSINCTTMGPYSMRTTNCN
jgi:hypothetical protein